MQHSCSLGAKKRHICIFALGNGLPLFKDLAKPLRVDLAEAQSFPDGTVIHVYQPITPTGLTSDDYEELDDLARDRGVGVIAAGNFSVMAAVLRHAAWIAAQHLDRWEIIDYASDDKPDVPSGTSRELAETLAGVRQPVVTVEPSDLQGPVEARGARVAGTQIHSVRLPSFVVSTEVVFGGPGERLVLRHDPGLTPAPYVAGTLLAVRKVAEVVGVRRGLDWLLFGPPAPLRRAPEGREFGRSRAASMQAPEAPHGCTSMYKDVQFLRDIDHRFRGTG